MTAPIASRDLDGLPYIVTPGPVTAQRHYFDTRANRALRGTLTGESMTLWGPRYIRESRAVLRLSAAKGQLWQRILENAGA